MGGVDAARRVQAGEAFDVVILAADAIDKLMASGHLLAGSKVDLVRSGVAVAVREGAARPDISSEEAVRAAVLAARSISYSTGPSGVALAKLFERWGIAEQIQDRIVTPPPGIPVGSLVAKGEVELGFQQLSELISQPGITVLGPLPPAIQIVTIFSAGLCAGTPQGDAVRAMLSFMNSPEATAVKRRQGGDPAGEIRRPSPDRAAPGRGDLRCAPRALGGPASGRLAAGHRPGPDQPLEISPAGVQLPRAHRAAALPAHRLALRPSRPAPDGRREPAGRASPLRTGTERPRRVRGGSRRRGVPRVPAGRRRLHLGRHGGRVRPRLEKGRGRDYSGPDGGARRRLTNPAAEN